MFEIIIKKEVIIAEADRLEKISEAVSARKIESTISDSKGKTAQSMNDFIHELNNMGIALGALMSENAENVRRISEQFSLKDNHIAKRFKE